MVGLIKKIFFSLLLILLVSFNIDKDVPVFEFQTLNGKIITSEELKGKIILLDFWDTHC